MTKQTPTEFYKKLGKNLVKARSLAGMRGADVAEKFDITFQQVQKYEAGLNRIPVHHLITLRDFTGVSLDELTSFAKQEDTSISNRRFVGFMRRLWTMSEEELEFIERTVIAMINMNDKIHAENHN